MATTNNKTLMPPALLTAIALMLMTVISLIGLSRADRLPQVPSMATSTGAAETVVEEPANPVASRMLSFIDHADGSVEVIDQQQNTTLKVFKTGEGSFVRGVVRTLTKERRSKGFNQSHPFELKAEAANQLVLIDKATGRTLVLNSFGRDNVDVFVEILTAALEQSS